MLGGLLRGWWAPTCPSMQGRFDVPGYNWMISANGVLGPKTSLEVSVGSAHNSIDIYATNESLTKSACGGCPTCRSSTPRPSRATCHPRCASSGGRVGSPVPLSNSGQGPFTNFNTTYDVIANLTKVWRRHASRPACTSRGA